jgi:GTP-binding protein
MNWQNTVFLKSTNSLEELPEPTLPEFVIVGRSNVGKSSFINAVTKNGKLAKISSKPGKTRLINHFIVDEKAYFVDLPGYGYAAVNKTMRNHWNELLGMYLLTRSNIKKIIILVDIRIGLLSSDREFIKLLEDNYIGYMIICTKSDKLSNNKIFNANQKITKELGYQPIAVSTKNNSNIEKVKKSIEELI